MKDYDIHNNKSDSKQSRRRDRDYVEQEDCGKLAANEPKKRNSICKINKEELFQVELLETIENDDKVLCRKIAH